MPRGIPGQPARVKFLSLFSFLLVHEAVTVACMKQTADEVYQKIHQEFFHAVLSRCSSDAELGGQTIRPG